MSDTLGSIANPRPSPPGRIGVDDLVHREPPADGDAPLPPGPIVLRSERLLPLGRRTQARLLSVLERQAYAILVAALETAGHDVADGWALRGELRLERVGGSEAPAPGEAGGT